MLLFMVSLKEQTFEIYLACFIHNDIGAFDWENENDYYLKKKLSINNTTKLA